MTRIIGADRRVALCLLAAAALASAPSGANAFAPLAFAGGASLASSSSAAADSAAADAALRPARVTRLYSEAAAPAPGSGSSPLAKTDDDEEEWEYVEFENLTEEDFYNSEWKVGTVWDDRPNQIKETWARLVTQEGDNLAVWGDGSKGKWNFDVASQFLSVSKESFGGWLGKRIWAGVVDDYYYMQGTIRGWSPISPASVLGQWQAKRLGVDPEEAGTAPWFETSGEEGEAAAET